MDLFNFSTKVKQLEEIQMTCAERFSLIPLLRAKIDETQAKIQELEEKIAHMEGGLKAFLNMQSMIAQENINVLELLVAKIGSMEKNLVEKLSSELTDKKITVGTKSSAPPIPKDIKIDESGLAYSMQTMVTRNKFLHIQRYLADEKATGKGKLLSENPLTILYYHGEILSLYIPNQGQNLAEFSNSLQELREQELEKETPEDLIARLAEMIQQRNQYLSGLTQVLGKLSKKQLIERIRLNTPPLLETKEDVHLGEATFHYIIKNWPKSGSYSLLFQFSEENITHKKEDIPLSIAYLVNRSQRLFCSEIKENII